MKSRFEKTTSEQLTKLKLRWEYEPDRFVVYIKTVGKCTDCKSTNITMKRTYLPDFKVNGKFYIETKGKFTSKDRTKLLNFVEQYPDIDFRILFMRDNRLVKGSKMFYSTWAKKNGIKYAVGTIPKQWVKEFKS